MADPLFLSAALFAILSQLMVSVPVPFHIQGKPPLLSQKVLVLGRKLGARNNNKGMKVFVSGMNLLQSLVSGWDFLDLRKRSRLDAKHL